MPRQIIDTGTLALNGQDGDTNRDAAAKTNANFQELYAQNENFVRGAGVVPGGALVVFAGTTGNQVAAATGGAPGTAAFANVTQFATAAQGTKADNAQAKLSAGDNITIDDTDPLNPIISASGGGGAVATVAGVEPFGGDISAAALATAIGVDNKLDKTATAAAATKLATARNINGVAFDGTANITVADNTKEPAITTGTAAKYWNGLKTWTDLFTSVRAATLTELSLATSAAVVASDTVLTSIGKLQAQVSLKFNTPTGNTSQVIKGDGTLASIVGTVSQSGGVPSGAIIERGANANGEYTKFADGTMICTGVGVLQTTSSAIGSSGLFFSPTNPYSNFPMPFAGASPRATYSAIEQTVAFSWVANDAGASLTACTSRLVSTSATATAKVTYIAIGRWF